MTIKKDRDIKKRKIKTVSGISLETVFIFEIFACPSMGGAAGKVTINRPSKHWEWHR